VREEIDPAPNREAFSSSGELRVAPTFPPSLKGDDDAQVKRRLQFFMIARLIVATLLLGNAFFIAVSVRIGVNSFTPRSLIFLIVLIYASTLIFALWLVRSRKTDGIVLGQIIFDLFVTTALVFLTGGSNSGFTFLYGVTVLLAAMVRGPVHARMTGILASVFYIGIGIGFNSGWIPPPSDQPSENYLLESVDFVRVSLTNVFGLLLVTLLASGLATRLRVAGGQLRVAEASAAQLARLNNDIVRSLGSGLLTTDLNGRIQTMNPTGIDMFRCSEETVIGKPIGSFLSKGPSELSSVPRAEGIATRPDGSTFPVGFSTNALQNEDGVGIGTVVVFQDLTEISQLRDAANRADRLATLGRLSAGLAHEIRNPLNSISGSVELVRDSSRLDEQERRLLNVILKETERLNDLVSTMLQVGRPVSPQMRNEELRQIVNDVVEMAGQNPSTSPEIKIETALPDEPVIARVDGDQIKQVLWNLIKNALQASPHGATVRVSLAKDENGRVVIEVSDQGMGIDTKNKDRIFDMFYSERTHGAGIGLALVRQIVDAHKGSIEVTSSPNSGATFRVALPAV
jgi:two-component system, NtrC family, sensor histidine kinase PilS